MHEDEIAINVQLLRIYAIPVQVRRKHILPHRKFCYLAFKIVQRIGLFVGAHIDRAVHTVHIAMKRIVKVLCDREELVITS